MFYLFAPLTLLIEAAAACFYVWLRWRKLRTNTVTNALSLVVGQNLPLVEGLLAMAQGERGASRRILETIAGHLALGNPVSVAVREAHRTIPGEVLGAIQAGEEAGTLPTVLRNIDQAVRQESVRSAGTTPSVVYITLLAMLLIVHVMLVTTFLVPKFRDIFADFGVRRLPWATEFLMSLAAPMSGAVGPIGWLVWLMIPVVVAAILIGRYFIVREPDRVQPLFRVLDALCWYCPGLRQMAQTRALSRQLPILTASVRAGHDLPAAATHAAATDANHFARSRLERWAQLMTTGVPAAEAAQQAKLPWPFRRLAGPSRSQEEMLSELSYLSSYYERLAFHWQRIVTACVTPILVMIASAGVGFVVIALYLPLRMLLNSVMSEMY